MLTQSCATGGKCATGDKGPGGGTVVSDDAGALIEVAPVTWYASGDFVIQVVARLTYGGQADWRLPSSDELVAVRGARKLFRCPKSKRCAQGFANAKYWSMAEGGLQAVDFAGVGPAEAVPDASLYVRPVRTISSPPVNIELVPS